MKSFERFTAIHVRINVYPVFAFGGDLNIQPKPTTINIDANIAKAIKEG